MKNTFLFFFTLFTSTINAQEINQKLCDFVENDVDSIVQTEGQFSITDNFINSGSTWEIDWDENLIFNSLLQYTNNNNPDQSYELRLGKGGQVYSFKTSGFGEALPPQWRPSYDSSGTNTSDPGPDKPIKSHHGNWAPWNDEVWQFVGSDQKDINNSAVKTRNIHQGGSYMNNFAHRNSDLTNEPFSSPIVQSFIDSSNHSITTISWGQSENPSYVYDPYADCTTCFSSPFKALVLYFQRYKNIGNGVIQVDYLIYNFNHDRGIDYWNIPFVGIRNSSLPYAFISNSPINKSSYISLNSKPGHPISGDENSYLPEFKAGALVKTSGNNSSCSGWFAFSNSSNGIGPSLGFVTSKQTNNPSNGYGDIRYGTAMSNAKRDVTIFTRRAIGGAVNSNTGLKPWGIIGGESIKGRYYIVVDQSIDNIVNQINTRSLTENSFVEKASIIEKDTNNIHYEFMLENNNTIKASITNASDAFITLNSKPFSGSYPVFMITNSFETVLCSNPYLYSTKPYDGNIENIELLGFKNTFQDKIDIQPIVTSNSSIQSSYSLAPNPSKGFIKFPESLKEIITIEGHKLFQNDEKETSLNISSWLPGIYFAVFSNNHVIKFVKI